MFSQLPPLTLYIHFPWCVQKCPYCDFNSHPVRGEIPEQQYINQLLADFYHDLKWIQDRKIEAIFCGGGTPSLFSASSLQHLLATIREQVSLTADCEITLEANPGTIDQQYFAGYYEAGINRLSLGVQTWDDKQLQRLGRIHRSQQSREAITILKAAGFQNFNIDLMYGLPQQTISEALQDLRYACTSGATHISWYHLTLEPNTQFYYKPPKHLPDQEFIWDLEQQSYALLAHYGWQRYEVSAYAKAESQCRHNLNYWQFGDYLGIGAGAHSKLTDGYTQQVWRFMKHKHPKHYMAATEHFCQQQTSIATKDLPFEFMLNTLRLCQPIQFSLFERYTGLDRVIILPILEQLQKQQLMMIHHHDFELTALGQRFLNDVVAAFLISS